MKLTIFLITLLIFSCNERKEVTRIPVSDTILIHDTIYIFPEIGFTDSSMKFFKVPSVNADKTYMWIGINKEYGYFIDTINNRIIGYRNHGMPTLLAHWK